MIEIKEGSVSYYSDHKCPFAEQCVNESDCKQIVVVADRQLYCLAGSLGLRPEIVDERMATGNYLSEDKVTEIRLCEPAVANSAVMAGLREFMTEASPATLIDDAEELTALREVDGIITGEIDVDSIRTKLGMAVLERVTGGEYISDWPLGYRLTDLAGRIEAIPTYELEVPEDTTPDVAQAAG